MDPTRRSFLTKTAVGAAGTAAVLGGGIALGSSSGASERPLSSDELDELDQPVLVQIRDARSGEVEVLAGEREVTFTDRALVAKVLRAAR